MLPETKMPVRRLCKLSSVLACWLMVLGGHAEEEVEHFQLEAAGLKEDGALDRMDAEALKGAAKNPSSQPVKRLQQQQQQQQQLEAGLVLKQRTVSGVFVDGFYGYRVFRIPAIVQHEGILFAFVEARRHGDYDQDHIDILLRRSKDEGKSWEEPDLVVGYPNDAWGSGTDTGQPTPIVDQKAGKILLVYCVNNSWVWQVETSDLGATWSTPRNITSMVKRAGWGWMATGPSHGLATASGRLIVPFNTFLAEKKVVTEVVETGCAGTPECSYYHPNKSLSLKYTITNTADPNDLELKGTLKGTKLPPDFTWAGDRSGVFYSDDHGATWHIGGQISDYVSSSENTVEEIFVGNRSELLMSFRVEDNYNHCRKMAKSLDGGLTFQPYFEPRSQNGTCIPDPTCQGSVLSLFGGKILLTSGPGSKKSRVDLSVQVSLDGGKTFELLSKLMDGEAKYSDLVFLGGTPDNARAGVLFGGSGGVFFVAFDITAERSGASIGSVPFII
mmetsp:Transcript_6287/g.15461  ORF Transcript_6287/g.15461 Transcript_6287/m.15461 type:complete len:501 (-) Transcript_6287:60-1562(-)